MSWLLLVILIIGWFLTVDGAVSFAFRFGELDNPRLKKRQKIEFVVRIVRGILGLILIVSAFYMAF